MESARPHSQGWVVGDLDMRMWGRYIQWYRGGAGGERRMGRDLGTIIHSFIHTQI